MAMIDCSNNYWPVI